MARRTWPMDAEVMDSSASIVDHLRGVGQSLNDALEDHFDFDDSVETVSWLEFYKALVRDDVEVVRDAIRYRDYRLQLEDGQSAIELAVRAGSVNSVKVMIDDLLEEHDSYEQYRVLVHACFSACNGGQPELLKILLDAVRPQMTHFYESVHFLGIYEKAVENCSMELMDIIERFTTIETGNMALLRRAFINGKRNVFERLFNAGGRTAAEVANEMPVPVLLVHIALGDQESVLSQINSNPNWHEPVAFGDDGNGILTMELNAFGVAGNFCDIAILEILYDKTREDGCEIHDLEGILEKGYKHAMFHDGVDVIQWMIQKQICDIRMPYEVDVECSHCYPHIDPNGRVFKYLESMGHQVKMSEEAKMEKVLNVIGDVVAHGSESLVNWYLSQVTMNENLALTCLKSAVAFDRPLFIERFLPLVEFNCDTPLETVHEVLRCALQCTKKRNRRLPSPITFEMLFNVLPTGSTCKCGDSVFFDLFLDMDYAGGHSHRGEDILPFNLTCRHIKILIAQMVRQGSRPKLKTVKRAIFNFLSNIGASSLETCFGARVIWLFDWYDISDLVQPFKIDQCAIWFIRKFEHRDAVLSELLQSLCGNKDNKIRWDGLLVYIINPDERRRRFIKCIHEFGLVIQDKYMSKVSDEIKRTDAYKEVMELTKPRLLSLQSASRIMLHKNLRVKTTEFRKRHDRFLPLCETVSIWAEARGIPKQIMEFMTFKDCFDDWTNDLEPHIHESVRELVFDVTEVLFMHPQLRDNLDVDDD